MSLPDPIHRQEPVPPCARGADKKGAPNAAQTTTTATRQTPAQAGKPATPKAVGGYPWPKKFWEPGG